MTFEEWKAEKEPHVRKLFDLLSQVLADDPEQMWQQLKVVEAWGAYAVTILATADAKLDEEESRAVDSLKRSATKMTAFEMEVKTAAMVSPAREFRDQIEGLGKKIEQKVMLGQSRMKSMPVAPGSR